MSKVEELRQRVAELEEQLAEARALTVKIERDGNGPATIKVWRHGVLVFAGADHSAALARSTPGPS